MDTTRFLRVLLACAGILLAPVAQAQDDPPGRVGRVADVQGRVSWFDHEQGTWAGAERNRPLTSGDRVSTAADGRAELRVGSTVLRLGGSSELEVLRLDDERMVFQLHAGELALRVRSRDVADEIEVATPEARLRPLRSGHYRISRVDDTTYAGSWRGDLRVDDGQGWVVASGQRIELYRDGRDLRGRRAELRHAWGTMPDDGFAAWAVREDRRDDQRSASSRYVSPEMTGAEDLDRYGRWDRHPDYGPIWVPIEVSVGWAPYRQGHWAWVRPWGWTWIDEAPWGFAPFHYGRWVWWGGRWGWTPGGYVARPVFAPALVAWVGGGNWSVAINLGGPAVGWVPLAPHEVYVPWYRHTPVYVDRVNVHPPRLPGYRPPPQRTLPTGPIMYSNQGVPGGVTVVPRDVLVERRPVGRAVVEVPELRRAPITAGQAPPAHEWRGRPGAPPVQMVPGGAVAVPPLPPVRPVAPVQPQDPAAGPPPAGSGPGHAEPPRERQTRPGPSQGRPEPGEVIDLRRQRPRSEAPAAAQPAPVVPVAPAAPAAPAAPTAAVPPPARPAPPMQVQPPRAMPAIPAAPAATAAPAAPAAPAVTPVPPPQAQPPVPPPQAQPPAPPPRARPEPPRKDESRERDDERKRIPDRTPRDREALR